MSAQPRRIRLRYPRGNRWRSLLKLPEIAQSMVNLNDPTSEAVISLEPGISEARIQEIVRLFEATLDPGSGPIEIV
jgi:hypothetical protein